ncbi:hypothetical protein [Brassicibacter mesophilus]|uniref:hypothetical protein n=1 Tax=Brassicibacter mesophilus TaxID=745119 RepID=UPI003D23120A
MDCKEVIKNMDKYFESRLTDIEVHNIKKHLDKCNVCRVEYEDTSYFFDAMAKHQPIFPPVDFTDKVLNKIANYEKVIKFRQAALKTWGISFVAAGMMFILCNIADYNPINLTNGLFRGALEINQIVTNPLTKMSQSLKYFTDYLGVQSVK